MDSTTLLTSDTAADLATANTMNRLSNQHPRNEQRNSISFTTVHGRGPAICLVDNNKL